MLKPGTYTTSSGLRFDFGEWAEARDRAIGDAMRVPSAPTKPKAKPAEPLDTRAVGGFVQSSPRFVRAK